MRYLRYKTLQSCGRRDAVISTVYTSHQLTVDRRVNAQTTAVVWQLPVDEIDGSLDACPKLATIYSCSSTSTPNMEIRDKGRPYGVRCEKGYSLTRE